MPLTADEFNATSNAAPRRTHPLARPGSLPGVVTGHPIGAKERVGHRQVGWLHLS